jgi:hypothetical protein
VVDVLIAIAIVLMLYQLVPRGGPWYLRLGRETMIIVPAVFLYFAVRGVVAAREEDALRNAEARDRRDARPERTKPGPAASSGGGDASRSSGNADPRLLPELAIARTTSL